jgi:hypothetical protein
VERNALVTFPAGHAQLLSSVKQWREHHCERREGASIIWSAPNIENGPPRFTPSIFSTMPSLIFARSDSPRIQVTSWLRSCGILM